MLISIHCTPDQATVVRDALHNYYHEAKPLQSERAKHLRDTAKDCADQLARRLMIANDQTHIKIYL